MSAGGGAGSNRRLFVILGVGGVLILLNFLLPKLLFRSDSSGPSLLPRPSGSAAGTTTTTTGTPGTLPETFEVFSMKNPFTPVFAGGGFPPTGGTTTTTFPIGGGTTTTTFPLGGTTTTTFPIGGTTTTTFPDSTEPRVAQHVEMLELFTDTDGRVVSQVRVDDVVSKVGTGDTFATSYKVVSLSLADQCGVFLFGDDRFNLCVGQEVLK